MAVFFADTGIGKTSFHGFNCEVSVIGGRVCSYSWVWMRTVLARAQRVGLCERSDLAALRELDHTSRSAHQVRPPSPFELLPSARPCRAL